MTAEHFHEVEGKLRCTGPDGTTFEIIEDERGSGIVLGYDDEAVFVPVGPTVEARAAFHAAYIAPMVDSKPMPFGVELLANVAAAPSRRADELSSPNARSVRYHIGNGDFDETMVMIENAITLNSLFATEFGLQATANGAWLTQQRTKYSRSLVSVERWRTSGESAVFVVQVDYEPHLDEAGHELLASELPDAPPVPRDVPLDAAGILMRLFSSRTSLEELAARVAEDSDWLVAYGATLPHGRFGEIVEKYASVSADTRWFVTGIALNRPDAVPWLRRVLEDPDTKPAVVEVVRKVLAARGEAGGPGTG
ncbi:MAG TPA: hypothetical protein VFQ53_36765 [Kofleriaceae bacterium]|nr:hypothetical protein [Kofleriaceae bacterium]